MDLSLKKKTEAVAPVVLNWHPNFRNYQRLPDIKVVRTAFFINTVAVTIVVFFAAFLCMREYQLHSINVQIAEAQARIDRDKPGSDRMVESFKAFQAEERRLQAVSAFTGSRPAVTPIILRLAETLPSSVALSLVDIREKGVTVRGVVRGSPDLAAGRANAYVDLLRKDKELSRFFDEVSLAGMNPNAVDGRLSIELNLRFSTPRK
jgi:hypothetical protein